RRSLNRWGQIVETGGFRIRIETLCVGLLVARVDDCRPRGIPTLCNCDRRPGPSTTRRAALPPPRPIRIQSPPVHPGDRHVIRFLLAIAIAAALAAQTPSLLEQADEAFRQGDFDLAGTLAQRALERDPAALQAHMVLGLIAARKNQWEASNRHFQKVV